MRYRGMTPEQAESEAVCQLREAEKMLKDVESMNAPDHVLERFRSHARLMKLQTAESDFRRGEPLPIFTLIDGAHRWYIAVSRNEESIHLSLPRCKELEVSRVRDWNPIESLCVDVDKDDAYPEWECCAPEATSRGARVNFLSQVNSPMTFADRVFLLQSWYLGTLDEIAEDWRRDSLRVFLKRSVILHLLAHAVREYENGALCRLPEYQRMVDWAEEGQKALDRGNLLCSGGTRGGSRRPVLRLPPIDAVLVAPSAITPHRTLIRRIEFLVNCAIPTAKSPVSRILIGHALRTGSGPGRDRGVLGAIPSAAAVAATGSWTMSFITLQSLSRMLILSNELTASVERVLGDSSCMTALDVALMVASAVGEVEVCDLRLGDDFPKVLGRKHVRVLDLHFPEKTQLLKSVVEVAISAWLQGAPFGEICSRLSSMRVVVGNARLGLGHTMGSRLDTQEISFLLRVRRGGIFDRRSPRVGYADTAGSAGTGHSTKCFLTCVPKTELMQDPREVSNEGLGGTPQVPHTVCDCDFFTGTAAADDMAFTHAFFLSRRPVTDLCRSEAAASDPDPPLAGEAISNKVMGQNDVMDQLLQLRNGKQGARVREAVNNVEKALAMLEAARMSHFEEAMADDCMALFMRRMGFLDAVQDVLQRLCALAREVGLAHHADLEDTFSTAVALLQAVENTWIGCHNLPGLRDALEAYEPEGPEKHYKSALMSSEGTRVSKHSPSYPRANSPDRFVATSGQDVVSLWRTRVNAHKIGTSAMAAAVLAERKEMRDRRRAGARVDKFTANGTGAPLLKDGACCLELEKPLKGPSSETHVPGAPSKDSGRDPMDSSAVKTTEGKGIGMGVKGMDTGKDSTGKDAGDNTKTSGASADAQPENKGEGVTTRARPNRGSHGTKHNDSKSAGNKAPDGKGVNGGGGTGPLPSRGGLRSGKSTGNEAPVGKGGHGGGGTGPLPSRGGLRSGKSTGNEAADGKGGNGGVGTGPLSGRGGLRSGKDKATLASGKEARTSHKRPMDAVDERATIGVPCTPPASTGNKRRKHWHGGLVDLITNDNAASTTGGVQDKPNQGVPDAPPAPTDKTFSKEEGEDGTVGITAHGTDDTAGGETVIAPPASEGAGTSGPNVQAAQGAATMTPATGAQVPPVKPVESGEAEDDEGAGSQKPPRDRPRTRASGGAVPSLAGDGNMGDGNGGRFPAPGGVSSTEAPPPVLHPRTHSMGNLDLLLAAAEQAGRNADSESESVRDAEARGTRESAQMSEVAYQKGAVSSLVFEDVNEHTLPRRVTNSAGAGVETVRRGLPVTVARGCNTKWFVTVRDLEKIREDHTARGLSRTSSRDEGGVKLCKLRDVVRDLDRNGFAIVIDAFDGDDSRRDIDMVVDAPVRDLKLVQGVAEEGKSVNGLTHFAPIPNPCGGRSMTSHYYWGDKEACRTKEDEKLARASHRHLVRACHLVEEILACDVDYHDPPCPSRPHVLEHRCPNTGGRVLITHPPTVAKGEDEAGAGAEGALPQRPHIDFPKPIRGVPPNLGALPSRARETPLFVIATGRVGTALRVYPASHLWAFCKESVHAMGVQESEVQIVHVPPYSFLMVRGDCYHGGAGWLESKWVNDASGVENREDPGFTKGIARWHMYLRTNASAITNAIHYGQLDEQSVFAETDKHIMPPINGRVCKGYRPDFSFEMTRGM